MIVPGIPLEDGKWSSTMKGRIYRAKYLYDEGITKNILFPRSAVYTPYYEGKIMSLYAIELSVPPGMFFTKLKPIPAQKIFTILMQKLRRWALIKLPLRQIRGKLNAASVLP